MLGLPIDLSSQCTDSEGPVDVKLRQAWQGLRATFWFIPAVLVAAGLCLAFVLVAADGYVAQDVFDRWPRLFGAGAAGARGLLETVASSMITVAGVVFSITIVVLSLASNQYSSRVLRSFMGDRVNQLVLGVFVGVFVYCLAVLRTIRGGDEGAFVPSLAVFFALLLALLGVAMLIYFVHHISVSIQAAHILANVAAETLESIERHFPEGAGNEGHGTAGGGPTCWHAVAAASTGYIQSLDLGGLVQLAADRQAVVRLERAVGQFVIEGTPLVSLSIDPPGEADADRFRGMFAIERQRVVQDDPAFGIRLIVDVALKALSPGVNDTTTAVTAIDYLTAILLRIGPRPIPSCHADRDGRIRVLTPGPSYANLVDEAFDEIRANAAKNFTILYRLLAAIGTLARGELRASRRRVLREQAHALAYACEHGLDLPRERARARQDLARLMPLLEG
jgi:uncharacterized membrane protein